MLQIRRETDYAIRCIYYLSGHEGEVIMVDEISREMKIPKSFLAKILQKLSKAEIVKSYVGVKGGFYLARKPSRVSLYDVIVAIEGPVTMNRCTISNKSCSLSGTCRVHPIWINVRREVEEILKKSNFQSLRSSSG
jgi:Rrf2 family protein